MTNLEQFVIDEITKARQQSYIQGKCEGLRLAKQIMDIYSNAKLETPKDVLDQQAKKLLGVLYQEIIQQAQEVLKRSKAH